MSGLNDRRAAPPWRGSVAALPVGLWTKAKQAPVSPGNSGSRTHTYPCEAIAVQAMVLTPRPEKRRRSRQKGARFHARITWSHAWIPESGASQVCVHLNAGADEPVVP